MLIESLHELKVVAFEAKKLNVPVLTSRRD